MNKLSKQLAVGFCLSLGLAQSAPDSLILVNAGDNIRFYAGDARMVTSALVEHLRAQESIGDYYRLHTYHLSDKLITYYHLVDDPVSIDSVLFIQDETVSLAVRRRIFAPLLHSVPYRESRNRLEGIRSNYSFVTDRTGFVVGRLDDGRLAAVVRFRPEFESHVSGLMGVNRTTEDDWELTGQLDLHLENAWHTAGLVEVHWQRTDPRSQSLRLALEEPHPFGIGLGVNLEYLQDLRDGLYLSTTTGGAVVSSIPGWGKWQLGGRSSVVKPTEEGDSLGIRGLVSRTVTLSSRGDRRDDRWLPRSGSYWSVMAEAGGRREDGVERAVGKFAVDLQWLRPFGRHWHLQTRLWGKGVKVVGGSVHLAEKVRYGGAATLRGVREEFLISDWVLIPSLEWHYVAGGNSHLFLLADIAWQSEYKPVPYAIGLGFRQVTQGAVVQIVYALGRGDRLSTGKLHVLVTGRI
jgi:hypothetical protein